MTQTVLFRDSAIRSAQAAPDTPQKPGEGHFPRYKIADLVSRPPKRASPPPYFIKVTLFRFWVEAASEACTTQPRARGTRRCRPRSPGASTARRRSHLPGMCCAGRRSSYLARWTRNQKWRAADRIGGQPQQPAPSQPLHNRLRHHVAGGGRCCWSGYTTGARRADCSCPHHSASGRRAASRRFDDCPA